MKASVDAVLDRLERHFTKTAHVWRDKPPPLWWFLLNPRGGKTVDAALLLKPTEKYGRQLFLREATSRSTIVVVLGIIHLAVFFGAIWYHCPPLFTNRRYHRLLIGILSHVGIYWLPWALLGLLAFSYALNFPRFYFWNRRAARLQREPTETSIPVVAVAGADASVWPPPPTRSDG